MKYNYFLCTHPADFYNTEDYLSNLKVNEFIKKKEKNILIFSSIFLKKLNSKNSNLKKIFVKFDKSYDLDFFDNGLNTSIINEIRQINYIKLYFRINSIKKKLKKIFKKNSKLFIGGGIADHALSSRVIIGEFLKYCSDQVFYVGLDLPIRDKETKLSFKSTFLSNLFIFLNIPYVKSYVDRNGIVWSRFFSKNIYKKIFILTSFCATKKNIIFFNKKNNTNKKSKKKKIILFLDKDGVHNYLLKKNMKNFIKTKEKVLKYISDNFSASNQLIFKPHPRQQVIGHKIYNFNVKYSKMSLEEIIYNLKYKLKFIVGVTSLGLKIANIHNIKTYSIKNILLKKHDWTNKRLDYNSHIINIDTINKLKILKQSKSTKQLKIFFENYYEKK